MLRGSRELQRPSVPGTSTPTREGKVPSNTPNKQLGPVAPGSPADTGEAGAQDQRECEEEGTVVNLPYEAVQSGSGGESQCPVRFPRY